MIAQIATACANLIFVSVPEEIFTGLMCTLMLIMFGFFINNQGEKDYSILTLSRNNIIKFSIPVVFPALSNNILKFIVGVPPNTVLLWFTAMLFVSVAIAYGLWGVKTISVANLKIKVLYVKRWPIVLICVLVSVLANMIIEIPYTYAFTYFLNKSVTEINWDIKMNFILVLPMRVIEYILLVAYLLKKRSENQKDEKVDVFDTIMKNTLLKALGIFVMIFSLIWLTTFGTIFVINRNINLMHLPALVHALFVSGVILVPICIIATYIFSVYCQRKRELEKTKRKLEEDRLRQKRLNTLTNIAKLYTNTDENATINSLLDEMKLLSRRYELDE